MTASTRAPFYDLFKLIVAIILLLLFIWLWLGMKQTGATQTNEAIALTSTPVPPSATPLPSSTVVPASATSLPPTATLTPPPTSTPVPPTETLSPTETPAAEALPTPIVEIPATTNVCESVARSQLQIGMQAIITHAVNLRSSPGVLDNWLTTNVPNTQVEIIDGPKCTRYLHGGSYLWWQIKLPNGRTGWSAEASAFGTFYFMEPAP